MKQTVEIFWADSAGVGLFIASFLRLENERGCGAIFVLIVVQSLFRWCNLCFSGAISVLVVQSLLQWGNLCFSGAIFAISAFAVMQSQFRLWCNFCFERGTIFVLIVVRSLFVVQPLFQWCNLCFGGAILVWWCNLCFGGAIPVSIVQSLFWWCNPCFKSPVLLMHSLFS